MAPTTSSMLGSPPYATTVGAVCLGGFIGIMLYGLTLHQTYRYYRLYPMDRLFLKVFVAVVFSLEALHISLWAIAGYHYLIAEPFYTVSFASLKSHWSVRLAVMSTACTVFIIQSYYAYRVHLIRPRYKWVVAPALLFLCVSAGFAIVAGVAAFEDTPRIDDFQRISWLVSVAYGLASITDVTLASTLVSVLRQSRTGSKRADSVLDTLMIYSINTGVVTSVFSTLSFFFAFVLPGNLIYVGLSIVGTKLYANSALALLNSRHEINNRFQDNFTSLDIPQFSPGPPADARRGSASVISTVEGTPQSSIPLSDCGSGRQSEDITFAAGRLWQNDSYELGRDVGGLKLGTKNTTEEV